MTGATRNCEVCGNNLKETNVDRFCPRCTNELKFLAKKQLDEVDRKRLIRFKNLRNRKMAFKHHGEWFTVNDEVIVDPKHIWWNKSLDGKITVIKPSFIHHMQQFWAVFIEVTSPDHDVASVMFSMYEEMKTTKDSRKRPKIKEGIRLLNNKRLLCLRGDGLESMDRELLRHMNPPGF